MKTFKKEIQEKYHTEIPDENQNGDCYVLAYHYFIDNHNENKNLKLVHGLVTGQGNIEGIVYNHAWIEDGSKVIDPSIQKSFPKSLYYKVGKIQEKNVYRYDFDQMMKKVQKFKTYGPWEKKLINNPY